ncbi:hypothetical protein DFH28DRAFT_923187 [Melampsora americana]|nr:hypothetical protein DFH28DRAFT_923187 [Melampsora americana]
MKENQRNEKRKKEIWTGRSQGNSDEIWLKNDRDDLDQICKVPRDRLLRKSVSESLGKKESGLGSKDDQVGIDEHERFSKKSDSGNLILSKTDDEDLSNLFSKVLKLEDTSYFCQPRSWPSQLSHEQTQVVEQISNKSRAMNELPGASCTVKDLSRLEPKRWLNDELINFYGIMINLRSQKDHPSPKFYDVHCFSSFFMTRLDLDGYQAVRRWTKKFNLFEKDLIIFPINLMNSHWICGVINLEKKRFEVLDSFGFKHFMVFKKLRNYLMAEHLDKLKFELDLSEWIDYYHPEIPIQDNGYDCGVFVCMFMDCLSRKWQDDQVVFDFEQKDLVYLRQRISYEIGIGDFIPDE